MKEHETDIRLQRITTSHPADHVHQHKCKALIDKAKVIAQGGHRKKEREVLEALFITTTPNCIARANVTIPREWRHLCYQSAYRQMNDRCAVHNDDVDA